MLDILETLLYVREHIQSNLLYHYIQRYGELDDLDYFEGRDSLSTILQVCMYHRDVDYYKKIELSDTTSVMVSYGNSAFSGVYADCVVDFFISSDVFLRKTKGSAFFDSNKLVGVLYNSLHMYYEYMFAD